MPQKKIKAKTLEENLIDPIYVNYNLLLKLDEIKNILLNSYGLQKFLLEKFIEDEKKTKEEKVGVFKNK